MFQRIASNRAAIAAMFFVNGVLFASWASRIPAVKQNAGLTEASLGAALFALGAGTIVALPITGWLIAHVGSRVLTVGAALASCVALPIAGASSSFAALAVSLAFFGASMAVMDVSMNSQASTLEKMYGRSIMSSFHGVWSVGGIAGAGTGAVLAAYRVAPSHQYMMVNVVLVGIALIAVRGLLKRQPNDPLPGAMIVWPTRAVLVVGLMGACAAMTEGGIADWSGVYLRDVLGTSDGFAAAGFAGFAATMAVGRFFGDRFIDRFGAVAVFRTGALLSALAIAAALLSHNAYITVAGLAVAGIGLSVVFPITFSAAGNISGTLSPSASIAAVATTAYAGQMMGPAIIGVGASVTSLPVSLGFLVLLCLIMGSLSANLKSRPSAVASNTK